MTILESELTSGVLYDCCQKVSNALLNIIDPYIHAKTYETATENVWYAEPEFTGKYIDVCVQNFRRYKEKKYLDNAKIVVESIINNQRADGYLGCLAVGKEFENFGVWNQTFTILGLISYYKVTGDIRTLEAAKTSVRFSMEHFVSDGYDIMDALNFGTQHISILFVLCDLYVVTSDEKIKEYILFIVDAIRNSKSNFFEFKNIFDIESVKGIENIVILIGILKYADLFDDKSAVDSVKKYWQEINDTQIRNTGNGTLDEKWAKGGNGCMLLGADRKPNETCVAVGWCELSLMLFYREHDKKYLDAIDKTLYNHLLAAISPDGSDFAYYQPNFGKKCSFTSDTQYKCCRYRGLTFFSYMNEMLYFEDDNQIIPLIYSTNRYESNDAYIEMNSNYPFNPKVILKVNTKKSKTLKLRIPMGCSFEYIRINDANVSPLFEDGYIIIKTAANADEIVEVNFINNIVEETGTVDGKLYKAFTYGPLLLAANDVNEKQFSVMSDSVPIPSANSESGLRFKIQGESLGKNADIQLCDYANADNFAVWLPVKK